MNQQLVKEMAFEVLDSEYLADEYAGFRNIIRGLVDKGSVLFPIHSPEIEQHLRKFSFVQDKGLYPKGTEIVEFTINLNEFAVSEEFMKYAGAHVKALNDAARAKEEELYALRREAYDTNELLAQAYKALIRRPVDVISSEPGVKQTWMTKTLEQGEVQHI